MPIWKPWTFLGPLTLAISFAGCERRPSADEQIAFTADTLRTQLETAAPGQTVDIPAGRFAFDRGLLLSQDDVTIRGAGLGKTILEFSGQIAGGEALLVTSNQVVIEGLSLLDSPGDALRVQGANGVVIRGVQASWTRGPHADNGAYGLYPVECTNVLVEDSIASGASDAGIYVGQSRQVILRRNLLFDNVAGIEVENSLHVDVHENTASSNAVGIVVQNLLDLPVAGHSVRVAQNMISDNNRESFAAAGSPVSRVPSGSGIYVGAYDRVEVSDNRIEGHDTGSVLISSYLGYDLLGRQLYQKLSADQSVAGAPDPFSTEVLVMNNTVLDSGARPHRQDFEALRQALFGVAGELPAVVWDGAAPPETTTPISVCNSGKDVLNLALDEPSQDAALMSQVSDCSTLNLPEVTLGQ